MQEEDEFYGMIHQARDEFLGKHEFQGFNLAMGQGIGR